MRKFLYLVAASVNSNLRWLDIRVEQLGRKGKLHTLSPDRLPNSIPTQHTISSARNPIVRKLQTDYRSPYVFLRLVNVLLKVSPDELYVSDIKYVQWVALLKLLFPWVSISIDIRENPTAHFRVQPLILAWMGRITFDRVITVSPVLRDLLEKDYNLRNVQYEFVLPSNAFLEACSTTRRDSDSDTITYCFFGDIREDRRIEAFANPYRRYFSSFRNSQPVFDLYGRVIHETYLDGLLGDDDAGLVRYKGVVSYRDIPRVMKTYDIGILTNELNSNSVATIPGKLWEYLACGLPVISLHRPSIDSIIEENDIGWVFRNANELIGILEAISRNPEIVSFKKQAANVFFAKVFAGRKATAI